MGKFKDLTGIKVGKWTVICRSDRKGARGEVFWSCRCDCGTMRDVISGNLIKGISRSCGCSNEIGLRSKTHGHTTDRKISQTYHTWAGMKARCNNPKNSHYVHYGAVGVKVCERWICFENFLADMGEKPEGMSLDRINPAGNYEPNNCRWANQVEQANNKQNNLFIAKLRNYPIYYR